MTTVYTDNIKEHLITTLRAGLVPFLAGSPGIGKSDIIHSIAKELNLKVVDHRLSTSDPTDLSGFPSIVNGKADYIPFELFPVEGTEVPKGYDGWLLFLDEFNSAPMSVQAAAYKLSLDRQVGQHNLHSRCACITAGNLSTDGAIVNDLSTAMQSRLIHFELEVNEDSWLEWAYSKNIDARVTSYINYAPEKLHSFDPNHNNKTFQCPRTWHFLSKLLTVIGAKVNYSHIPVLEGAIGPGAREFLSFCELEKDLPTFEEILKDPKNIDIPEEPSTMYFLCGVLASKTTEENIKKVFEYIPKFPIEFQLICIKDMSKRNPKLKKTQVLRDWTVKNAKELFSN